MILKQYYLGCLAHASYMIADERTRIAAVVDPQRDIQQYVEDAAKNGWTIRHVFLTHFHADFLAGHIELRNRVGATIHLGRAAKASFEFDALADGRTIVMGDTLIKAMETPGHTPESVSLLVYDLTKSADAPQAALTGDTLFIGDVGRPDLLASLGVTADELAAMLHRSVGRLRSLPDDTLVYPAHGAGSMCGKNLSNQTVSTIGEQKKFNYAMRPMPLDEFKRMVTADQPEAPRYFGYDAVRNREDRGDLDAVLAASLRALTLDETLALRDRGAQLLDTRDAIDHEGAHLAGSVNIGLGGKYATWCGTLLRHDAPIVVIAERGKEEESVMRLGRIGFDNVAGYLRDGMAALSERPELIASTPRITAAALGERLAGAEAPVVLDVRSEKEHRAGHIPGSLHIPLPHLHERAAEIPANREIVVHCEGGYRSATACGILRNLGRADLRDLVGGYKAWAASKPPVENEAGAAGSVGAAGSCSITCRSGGADTRTTR